MHPMARRMFELVEPIGVLPYSSEDANAALFELGFTDFWDVYFAGRAAPLGEVPAEVVDAIFYNFAPGEVARHIPEVWATTTPEAAFAARMQGCTDVLRRVFAEHVESATFARGTELLHRAATSAPLEGRPLYAALRARPEPADVVARFFHAASLLRAPGRWTTSSSRPGSADWSATSCTRSAPAPARSFGRIHHLPAAQIDEVIDGLRTRGLIGPDGWLTEEGRALHERVEARTDDLAAAPYAALSADELQALITALEPLTARLVAEQAG